MLKMLLVGYLYGIKSERRLVEEIQLNVAYRWFCGFSLNDKIPDHSTFSETRTRKWSPSALFQKAFRSIIKKCAEFHLVDREEMVVDERYIPASVSRNSWIDVEEEATQSMQSYFISRDLKNSGTNNGPKTYHSTTDSECGYIYRGSKMGSGYLLEATVDCKCGTITGINIYPANEKESLIVLRHLEKQILIWSIYKKSCIRQRI